MTASIPAAARPVGRWRGLRVLIALLLTLVAGGPVAAAEPPTRDETVRALGHSDIQARRDAASRLGDIGTMADVGALVRALRDDDRETRVTAELSIWRIWARSGDAAVDRLYEAGVHQMEEGDLRQAIETFTRIIERKPEFAEAWNKRATLYFMLGDLRKSLADCDQVMKRNPYHFGALAGYTQIYIQLEYYDRALDYARRALDVNPNMEGVRRNLELLEHVREQRRQQTI